MIWYKGGTAEFTTEWYTPSGSFIGARRFILDPANTWTLFETTLSMTAGNLGRIRVELYAAMPFGDVWWDDIEIAVYGQTTPYSISGRVTDPSGAPIGNANVVASGPTSGSAWTDPNGYYAITGLRAGNYNLYATKTGYYYSNVIPVSLPPNASNINFTLHPVPTTYTISGRVTSSLGGGISGATVSATGPSSGSTTTDANGYYTLSNLSAGTYSISASKSGYTSPSPQSVTVPPNASNINFTLQEQARSWTLMVYLVGDNDLDSDYVGVFNQLEYAADNPDVTVVVAWDRRGSRNEAYYKIKHDTDMSALAEYVEGQDKWSQNELQMDQAATLSDFVSWARSQFPAQHYGLFISDHGTGLNGTAWDWSSGNEKWLKVKDLGNALAAATSNGSSKIDVVFADSCLMAMIEDAYQIRRYANYYVASENLIWISPMGSMRPYSGYVSRITSITTPRQLAEIIVAEYSLWLNASHSTIPYTISAVDLGRIDPLISAINEFAGHLNANMSTHGTQVTQARAATQKFDSNVNYRINQQDQYVDLYDFAFQIKERISDTDIRNAAQNVMDAMLNYRVASLRKTGQYKGVTWDLDQSTGVSVFFPPNASSFYDASRYDFAVGAVWPGVTPSDPTDQGTDSVGWGPMLVNYFSTTQPGGPNEPEPPMLAAPLNPWHQVFVPSIDKGRVAGEFTWRATTALPTAFGHSPAVIHGRRVFMAGGEGPSGNTRSTVYSSLVQADGSLGSWQSTTPLPQPRHYHDMVTVAGHIYLVGGSNSSVPVDTIYFARPWSDGTINTWRTASLPQPLLSPMVVSYGNDSIYVLGGCTTTGCENRSVYYTVVYGDGSLEGWMATTSLPLPLSFGDAVTFGDRIYIVGGYTGTDQSTFVFSAKINADRSLGNWIALSNLPRGVANHVVLTSGSNLYVLGGLSGSSSQQFVYHAPIFVDGSLGAWQTTTGLSQAIHDHSGTVYNGRLYIVGGFSTLVNSYHSASYLAPGSGVQLPPCILQDGIVLYENTDYTGQCLVLTADDRNFNDYNFNDLTSSIRFFGSYASGWEVELYEHTFYMGASSIFRSSDPDLGNDAIGSDRASSIVIRRITEVSLDGLLNSLDDTSR